MVVLDMEAVAVDIKVGYRIVVHLGIQAVQVVHIELWEKLVGLELVVVHIGIPE